MAKRVLIKTTEGGRKLEVVGVALALDGRLEAVELDPVEKHPYRRRILAAMPEATHMAGRVPLTAAEATLAQQALDEAEAEVLANPAAIAERYRLAQMWRATEQGIE
jgi:hypothetical protein